MIGREGHQKISHCWSTNLLLDDCQMAHMASRFFFKADPQPLNFFLHPLHILASLGQSLPRGLPSLAGCLMSPLCDDFDVLGVSIYHLRTVEQYPRGLPDESTVQGCRCSLWLPYIILRTVEQIPQKCCIWYPHMLSCTCYTYPR